MDTISIFEGPGDKDMEGKAIETKRKCDEGSKKLWALFVSVLFVSSSSFYTTYIGG